MPSRFVCCLSALSFALATPLAAKTVYIPLTGQSFAGNLPERTPMAPPHGVGRE